MTVCGCYYTSVIRSAETGPALAVGRGSSVGHQSRIGEGRLCDNLKNYD
jgi:hypothetical protein